MAQDRYEDFAERYELFHDRWSEDNPAVNEFFSQLFTENNVTSVLDCACGTGRDLFTFHELGFKVVGADISAAMLAQARDNLAKYGVDIPLHQVDYRELPKHFSEPFDAVVCLSSSMHHMQNDGEAARALHSMRGVLKSGGILVLDQGTTDKQWAERPRFILASDTPEMSRLFVIDYVNYEGRDATYHILDIFRTAATPELKVWSSNQHILLRDDQERLLKEAGFRHVDFYGSYRFEPYDKKGSSRLITVARK